EGEELKAREVTRGLELLVGTDDDHAESRGAAPQGSPDPAHTDDAERLSLKLDPIRELLLRPSPRLQGGVGLRDPPREGKEKAQGKLGHRDGRGLGRVEYRDLPGRCGGEVNVVGADTGADDHP